MGEQRVSLLTDKEQMNKFVKSLLRDVQALEYMMENDWFDNDITRIGAEQEMVMVDKTTFKPATIAMEALELLKEYDWVETELAKFNLETNMEPRVLEGNCFSEMEAENRHNLVRIQEKLDQLNASIVLTGILPTLRKFDMHLDNLTPKKRYRALMEAINEQMIGESYELRLVGIDELLIKHDSPMLEACNTSFQIHLQVSSDEFVKMYNIAQALTAPVMAMAANSPLVFGRRLWHESRIALFQQSLDTRSSHEHMRERSPRVSFGTKWLDNSVMEIYKEDIARFRVLISGDVEEDSLEMVKQKKVPKLRSLQVHNSTVYRWNRPCYGISDNGKPHLRIENRVIPAGPTILDETANAVFWLGAMIGMALEVDDIRDHMAFDDALDNFGKAAKFGIDSKFTWFNDEKISVTDLVKEKLLPIARKGLESRKVNKTDIDKYLGVIEARAETQMNGARWMLRAYTKLVEESSPDEALTVLTSSIIEKQKDSIPVHEWKLPELKDLKDYRPSNLTVSECMTTDVFTVHKEDIIELVAELMDWNNIEYMPVEDTKGKLIGLISIKQIMRYYVRSSNSDQKSQITVEDIMKKDIVTASPDETIVEAMRKMRDKKVSSLPVVQGDELIGLITDRNLLKIAGRLLMRLE
jgi:CBS domain-containing protein/gamma-glutamylcysteine synthetase